MFTKVSLPVILVLLCFFLSAQNNADSLSASGGDPAVQEQIRKNDSLIKAYNEYEDSLKKISVEFSNRNLDELIKKFREAEERKKRQSQIYIAIGVSLAVIFVAGILRRRRKS